MPLFFIEMGQGILAKGDDVRVCTSPISSCTLIAGWNDQTGYGGAYHYPAGSIEDPSVAEDMRQWAQALKPTHLTLMFAEDFEGMPGTGTDRFDKLALSEWAKTVCKIVPEERDSPPSVGMRLQANGYKVGATATLGGNFQHINAIQLRSRGAGTYNDHGGFKLIGRPK